MFGNGNNNHIQALNNMLNKVIDEPKLNDKEFLLKHINDFIKERK